MARATRLFSCKPRTSCKSQRHFTVVEGGVFQETSRRREEKKGKDPTRILLPAPHHKPLAPNAAALPISVRCLQLAPHWPRPSSLRGFQVWQMYEAAPSTMMLSCLGTTACRSIAEPGVSASTGAGAGADLCIEAETAVQESSRLPSRQLVNCKIATATSKTRTFPTTPPTPARGAACPPPRSIGQTRCPVLPKPPETPSLLPRTRL